MTPFLADLRRDVLDANQQLAARGLTQFTFGNASAIDRSRGLIVIKPSGVAYDQLTADLLVVTDMEGTVVDGALRASSDLATHLVLYRGFDAIGGVVHTHSHYATAWAQAQREIPCLGTTHADHFHGPIPVTGVMPDADIASDYEANTGHAIVRRFADRDPMTVPAVLVAHHGPFCWGATVADAAVTAAMLEEVARLAYHTVMLDHQADGIARELHDRHFLRKHGTHATYGQQ